MDIKWHETQTADRVVHSHSAANSHNESLHNRAQWSPSLWAPQKAPGWQTICNRHWCDASCHYLATQTWYWFLLHRDTSLSATVGHVLKCQWWLHAFLMCTIWYLYTMYTIKSNQNSLHECVYYLIFFLNLQYLCYKSQKCDVSYTHSNSCLQLGMKLYGLL